MLNSLTKKKLLMIVMMLILMKSYLLETVMKNSITNSTLLKKELSQN